jgi:hypothetical protein
MSLLFIASVGLAAIVVSIALIHIVEAIDDARRARRRQRALDSLRWPE